MLLKDKLSGVVMTVIGVCLIGAAFIVNFLDNIPKAVGGLCIGIGASLFALGISVLIMRRFEASRPELIKQNEIELKDERNTMIRNRAKAKAGDIANWLVMGLAYFTILISAPLWSTLVVVGVFLIKYILECIFISRYQKEM